MKFLHPLQNQFMALAVRASESVPMVYPSKQFRDCCEAWRQREVQDVVNGHSGQEPLFPQRCEGQTQQQQNQGHSDLRIFFFEVVICPAPELDFHTVSFLP